MASWKARVRAAWPRVKVDHVETGGIGDVPQVDDVLHVRAYVSLDGLNPDDVSVQVAYGRVSETDEIGAFSTAPLGLAESYEAGRHAFAGDVRIDTSGPFGYTVRIVPQHAGLASVAEVGVVANA